VEALGNKFDPDEAVDELVPFGVSAAAFTLALDGLARPVNRVPLACGAGQAADPAPGGLPYRRSAQCVFFFGGGGGRGGALPGEGLAVSSPMCARVCVEDWRNPPKNCLSPAGTYNMYLGIMKVSPCRAGVWSAGLPHPWRWWQELKPDMIATYMEPAAVYQGANPSKRGGRNRAPQCRGVAWWGQGTRLWWKLP
jgi:hypothetical protein